MTIKDLAKDYGLSLAEVEKVAILFDLLYPDIDGIWSGLQDEGIDISIDDLAEVGR